MNVLVLQSFLSLYLVNLDVFCQLACISPSKLYHVSCIFVSCLMCSICQPSPHLNCLLYVIAMAELLRVHSLDLMEAYHLLYVGSPQGAPQL